MSKEPELKVVTGEASESESDDEVLTDDNESPSPQSPPIKSLELETTTSHSENSVLNSKTEDEVTAMKKPAEMKQAELADMQAEGNMVDVLAQNQVEDIRAEGSESVETTTSSNLNVATPLKIDLDGEGDSVPLNDTPTSPVGPDPLKYHTLLHKKLREKNVALHGHVKKFVAQEYTSSAHQLHQISQQMSKSQAAMQDISSCLQLLTNDLFHLEDKVNIITDYHILPLFNFDDLTPLSSP